jgi:hypothetical protein
VPAMLPRVRYEGAPMARATGGDYFCLPTSARHRARWRIEIGPLRNAAQLRCATSAGCAVSLRSARVGARVGAGSWAARPLLERRARPMLSDSREATDARTCTDCGARAPSTETNYTLISASHGWRLSRRPGLPSETPILDWRCPGCWQAYKRAGGKLRSSL